MNGGMGKVFYRNALAGLGFPCPSMNVLNNPVCLFNE
jgi:hypothetical protein